MKASDVMVTNVITVGPDACVQDVADLLLRHRISAVPVVAANGEILGIVSEGDLINRPESETVHRKSWWLDALASNAVLAAEYVKSHSRSVTDVMTRDVITASPDTSVAEVAALLEKNGIKRVPIVNYGKIVGIVSRANLLQGLASLKNKSPQAQPDDSAIREKVMAKLQKERWTKPALITVTVRDGNVELWGIVDSPAEKKAVHVLAEVTPGVRAVNDNLMIQPTSARGWM
jgi:CBS-domain-containing membrane protein